MKKEIQNCMTSELLFEALNDTTTDSDKTLYITEFERRLKIMRLSDEQISKFRECDEKVIKNGCYMKSEILLATKPFITHDMNRDSIKTDYCTFSELVYLTDDANSAYVRDHGWLPEGAFALVCRHALRCGTYEAAYTLRNRMKEMGLTEEQEGIFVKNECQIAKRLRWGYSNDPAWCE